MSRWQAALRLVGMGWYVVICIILGVLGGRWLDKELDTRFMIMVGLLAGVGLAFYGVYRMILPNINKKQNKGKS
ncbi:MAG: AtpZ/AtpI family protein [Dehalococcoidales bacterium]|nr:AtpZ/AtpI family protein [Dehalococcoidales bacterium]